MRRSPVEKYLRLERNGSSRVNVRKEWKMRNKILSQQKKKIFCQNKLKLTPEWREPMTYEKGVAMIDGIAVNLSKDMSGHEGWNCVYKA